MGGERPGALKLILFILLILSKVLNCITIRCQNSRES